MKKSIVRVALISGAALAALTPAVANHSWGPYHWAGDGRDLTLKVNTAITSQWNTSINDAISDWEQSKELTLNGPAPSAVDAKKCYPIAGQILACSASYGRRGWLGIASIWITTGNHIAQATTKLNDSYFDLPFYDTPGWRALVACQEIAHDFGLDHQDEAFGNVNLGTCMDYTNAPDGGVVNGFDYGPDNRHPNAHDFEQLKAIYNHDDGFTTATGSTNFGIREVGKARPAPLSSAGSGDSPSEWGRAIHTDGAGRPDVFLKDLGGGNKVITHVFWAVGEGPGRSQ